MLIKPFKNIVLLSLLFFMAGCSAPLQQAIIEPYYLKQKTHEFAGKKVILIGGCFDVLHYGHIEYLKKSKEQGDILVVALEPDASIINYKKRDPIHTQSERANNLAAIRYVDEVLLLPVLKGFNDYNQLVKDVNPDIIAIAANDTQKANKQRQADEIGAELAVVVESVNSFSSSKIIKSLSD